MKAIAVFPGKPHPVKGLENYQELIDTLTNAKGTIKVFCEIAPLSAGVRGKE